MRIRAIAVAAVTAGALTMLVASSSVVATAGTAAPGITFSMVRSQTAVDAGCLKTATATVRVVSTGLTETMTLSARGLPPKTAFDLFVIQLPNAPFGLSWYQSDLQSNAAGAASVTVIGRFNVETFAVAPGSGPAPIVHRGIDAAKNPKFAPIHTFHVGFWFNSPKEAVKAGCPGAVTPFNGDHNAGVQAMSTRNFADQAGPLRGLRS